VRAERLDGSSLGHGWAIFHRYGKVDEHDDVDYMEWDGYVELEADTAVDVSDRRAEWFASPFRVIPLEDKHRQRGRVDGPTEAHNCLMDALRGVELCSSRAPRPDVRQTVSCDAVQDPYS
jgi:hypothetical protein